MSRPMNTAEKFWSHFEKTDTCWLWTGTLNNKGYGIIRYRGAKYLTHKLAYILTKGFIPFPKQVMHSCNIRRCGNPDHLSLGTQKENTEYAYRLGRMRGGGRIKIRTHCNNGHELTPENTYTYKGYKLCKECHRFNVRLHRLTHVRTA
jgi:hypothetical protein